MNYLLLVFSLIATQAAYGTSAAAQTSQESAYGALLTARIFRCTSGKYKGCHIDFWGEAHQGCDKAAYTNQTDAIARFIEFAKKLNAASGTSETSAKPHLFLLEMVPHWKLIKKQNKSSQPSPVSYIYEYLKQNSANTASICFDERPQDLILLCYFVRTYGDILNSGVQTSKDDIRGLIQRLNKMVKDGDFIKAIQHIGVDTLVPELEGEIKQIASAFPATTIEMFVDAVHRYSSSDIEKLSDKIVSYLAYYGDILLAQQLHAGITQGHKRITVVAGANHTERLKDTFLWDRFGEFEYTGCGTLEATSRPLPAELIDKLTHDMKNDYELVAKQPVEADAKNRANVSASNPIATAASTLNNSKAQQSTCQTCGKVPEKQLRCGKCKKVYYCNADCQRADWPKHKEACGK